MGKNLITKRPTACSLLGVVLAAKTWGATTMKRGDADWISWVKMQLEMMVD